MHLPDPLVSVSLDDVIQLGWKSIEEDCSSVVHVSGQCEVIP